MKTKKFLTGMSAVALAAIMLTAVSASADAADAPVADSVDTVVDSAANVDANSAAPVDSSDVDSSDVDSSDVDTSAPDSYVDAPTTSNVDAAGPIDTPAMPDSSTAPAVDSSQPDKEPFVSVTDADELIPGQTDEKGSTVVVPNDKVADLPEGESIGIVVDFDTLESYYDPDASSTTTGVLKKANIAFVVDTTGSMSPYIKNVKSNLAEFVRGLQKLGVEPTMSVVEYRDINYNGKETTIFHDINGAKWSTDFEAVIDTLDRLTVYGGGGDGYESTLDAFDKLFDEDPTWYKRDGSSFVFVLTDEMMKEGPTASASGRSASEWTDIMARSGIQVSVVSTTRLEDHYADIVNKTGGSFFNINSSDYSEFMLDYATQISTHIDHTVPYTDRSITLANLKQYAVKQTGAGTVTFILTPDEAKALLGPDATDAYLSKFTFKLHGVDVIKVTITTDTQDMTETDGVTNVTPSAPAKKDPDANPDTGNNAKSMVALLALAGAIAVTSKVKRD